MVYESIMTDSRGEPNGLGPGKEWAWCEDNLGPYTKRWSYKTDTGKFYFYNEEDYMLYKLTWG